MLSETVQQKGSYCNFVCSPMYQESRRIEIAPVDFGIQKKKMSIIYDQHHWRERPHHVPGSQLSKCALVQLIICSQEIQQLYKSNVED